MKINRTWAMPDSNTFSIKPIHDLISRYVAKMRIIIDPFVRNSPFKNFCTSNDLDKEIKADYNIDALEFLKEIKSNSVDLVLFDPLYSARQISECYKKMNMVVNMETTQEIFWRRLKEQIYRITKSDAFVISCGWNSGGVGKKYGFNITEILLVPHGGAHNDTIVVVEQKTLDFFT